VELYLVRHGIAEEAREGQLDEDRALTGKGRRRTVQALRGLRRMGVRVEHVLSSPLVRAWQTARIVSELVGKDGPRVEAALAPGGTPRALCERLARLAPDARVALVGHEPGLGRLATWLAAAPEDGPFAPPGGVVFKKAGVARLDVEGAPRAGHARLLWVLEPKLLRSVR
jgi:phosphohistidine phosphatase